MGGDGRELRQTDPDRAAVSAWSTTVLVVAWCGEDGPAGRNGQAMAFHQRAGVVIMWGSTTGDTHLDDMWRWDGRRWTEIVDGPRPSKRVVTAMVYDVANRRIILYGGRMREDGKVRESGEMWE
jgi:hypothetical protein